MIPDTKGEHYVGLVFLPQQFHVPAAVKSADFLLALLKNFRYKGLCRIIAEGHFYNTLDHIL
jgi:hypothetical protein